MRRILHVDMDAFYAAVEQHDRPELRGKPVIVGGSERSRGVVCTASYEARAFGVRSAMPTSRAIRLCPQVIRVDPRLSRYREVSRQIMEIFEAYTPHIEPLSLDESFLDLSEYCAQTGRTAAAVAREIKQAVRERTGLTASAGAAPNKLVAKIASDIRKPDGIVVVPPERVVAFLAPLPVERLWGVGPVTAQRLHGLGLRTIGDLAARPVDWLETHLGRSGPFFHSLALGQDDRPVVCGHEPQSLSAETTFAQDVESVDFALDEMAEQADEVARRLERHGYVARTVTIKARYPDFSTVTRSVSTTRLVSGARPIFKLARHLLLEKTEFPTRPLRLVGVSVSGLVEKDRPLQLELWPEEAVLA